MNRRTLWVVTAVAVLIGVVVLIARGPAYFLGRLSGDFPPLYASAGTYLAGQNPYDVDQVAATWDRSMDEPLPHGRREYLLYPPTALMLLSPWALTPWPAVQVVWVLTGLVSLGVLVWGAGRFAGMRWREPGMWWLLAAAMLFMPVHTTFRTGQTALLASALIALSLLVRGRPTPGWACEWFGGVMVVLAAAIKPQLGLLFLVYELYRLNWKGRIVMLAAGGVIGAASLAWLAWHGVEWLGPWQGNVEAFTHGGAGDPTPANPFRYQMLNLQPAMYLIFGSRAVSTIATLILLAVVTAAALLRFSYAPADERDRLIVNLLCILTLLFSYHRYYDAVILVIPIAWVIARIRQQHDAWVWAVIVLLLPILTNSASAIITLQKAMGHPPAETDYPWWFDMFMLHTQWALLALVIVFAEAHSRIRTGLVHAPSTRSM